MCGQYPCRLVDPFTGKVTPLPDLPVLFSEESPMPAARDNPRFRVSTDDGFAWGWSPRGVMVARGDTAFFCETSGRRCFNHRKYIHVTSTPSVRKYKMFQLCEVSVSRHLLVY
jgi:hypothetical protein